MGLRTVKVGWGRSNTALSSLARVLKHYLVLPEEISTTLLRIAIGNAAVETLLAKEPTTPATRSLSANRVMTFGPGGWISLVIHRYKTDEFSIHATTLIHGVHEQRHGSNHLLPN